MDTGWRRNKYGGWFNVNDIMNNKIRNIKDYDEDEEQFKQDNSNVLYENQNLSDNQKKAITDYTRGSGYGDSEMINGYYNGTREMSDEAAKLVVEKADILESSITQPLNQDIYVYRKINIKGSEIREGQDIPNKGFTSTSLTMNKSSQINSGVGTIIKVQVKKGTKALYIGDKTDAPRNEHELLFGRGHSIKITRVEKLFDKDDDFMNYEVLGELI